MSTTAADRGPASFTVVIMAHPSRAAYANRVASDLAAQLGCRPEVVYDPEPDGPPSAMRTAALAWGYCTGTTSHHLVVQDDVIVSPDLASSVSSAIEAFPECALALYANANSWNGCAARVSILDGATWSPSVPDDFLPTLALVLPCPAAHEFADRAARSSRDGGIDDDELMAEFLQELGMPALVRAASLVDHLQLPSLSGYDDQGIRRAACFLPDGYPAELRHEVASLPAVARFADCEATFKFTISGSYLPTLSRSEYLEAIAVSWDSVCAIAADEASRLGHRPDGDPQTLDLIRELCLASYTLGWSVAAAGLRSGRVSWSGPIGAAALASYVEGGLAHAQSIARWQAELGALVRCAARLADLGTRGELS